MKFQVRQEDSNTEKSGGETAPKAVSTGRINDGQIVEALRDFMK
jgi:hypothetical protein